MHGPARDEKHALGPQPRNGNHLETETGREDRRRGADRGKVLSELLAVWPLTQMRPSFGSECGPA